MKTRANLWWCRYVWSAESVCKNLLHPWALFWVTSTSAIPETWDKINFIQFSFFSSNTNRSHLLRLNHSWCETWNMSCFPLLSNSSPVIGDKNNLRGIRILPKKSAFRHGHFEESLFGGIEARKKSTRRHRHIGGESIDDLPLLHKINLLELIGFHPCWRVEKLMRLVVQNKKKLRVFWWKSLDVFNEFDMGVSQINLNIRNTQRRKLHIFLLTFSLSISSETLY